MKEMKIYRKYQLAILNKEKNIEIRHKWFYHSGEIVKLIQVEDPTKYCYVTFGQRETLVSDQKLIELRKLPWWDNFCEEYVKKPTYIRQIIDCSCWKG
ncbi:MAG: hypothetical protein LBF00_03120 [Mycoplasmataceae bacterium]|jgi:uncharacterized protein YqfB (UPF0267 family)|nr:hypothetical protein [Mycoplasmataceae bacterium]